MPGAIGARVIYPILNTVILPTFHQMARAIIEARLKQLDPLRKCASPEGHLPHPARKYSTVTGEPCSRALHLRLLLIQWELSRGSACSVAREKPRTARGSPGHSKDIRLRDHRSKAVSSMVVNLAISKSTWEGLQRLFVVDLKLLLFSIGMVVLPRPYRPRLIILEGVHSMHLMRTSGAADAFGRINP